jgi:tetratricopeptide (TPR) repeat protein
MKDIFAIQDEITLAIVDELQVELSGGEKASLARRRAVDLEAYDLYLRGRYFWNQLGAAQLRKAIDHFERAIEKDPNYAQAYAGLADCYVVLRVENPLLSEEETYAKAREAALKALEIDETVPEVHVSLGVLKNFSWEWVGAEKEFKRAIELSPGSAFAHYHYSWQLMWKGRFDEAIREINLARELDPLSLLINKQVGVIFYNARRYDEAIEAERRTLEIAPNLPYARSVIAASYQEKSMYEEALAEFEKERELYEVWNPIVDSWIGIVYARMGKKAEAQKILDDMVERSKEGYVTPSALGNLYLELGEYDRGFEWLDKAYEDHDFWVGSLKVNPLYDGVRSDPRYIALLKKMGLDE